MTICVPLRPILLKIKRAPTKQAPTTQALKNKTKIILIVVAKVVLFSAYKITVVIDPGPINKGMATGTKIWLKLLRAWSNVVPEEAAVSMPLFSNLLFPCNMRSPTRKMTIEPASLNAGMVIPNIVSKRVPNRKNTSRSRKMEHAIRMATMRCTLGVSFSTCSRKIGTLPIGFKMAMIPMNEFTTTLHSIIIGSPKRENICP